MSKKVDTEDVKSSLAQKLMSRWLLLVAFAVPVGIANLIYGSICEGKCEELCQKEGFPISTWYSDSSSFWLRPFAAMSGRHGKCLCDRQRIGTAMFYNGPDKEIRLTFGN
jgi:hypothetical protein